MQKLTSLSSSGFTNMVNTDVTFGTIFCHAASTFFFFFVLCALINIQLLIVYKFLPSSTWICLAKKILELFEQTLRNKHRCHLLFVCAMRSTLRSVFTQFLFVYLFIYLFIFLLKTRNCFRISLDTYQHSLERNICVSVSQILTFLGWDG